MTCLDDRDVALFFAGRLGEEEIAALEAHIDGCAACLALVTAVAPAFGPSGEPPEPAGGKRKAGEVLAGRYEIQELLGAGATGSVYRAWDNLVDTVVALKVLHPHFAEQPAWVRTFREELQLTRRLIHPNVCRVFDMQQSEGVSFLTMEWAPGGSLADSIRRTPDSALSDRVCDGVALAHGVAAMHAAGLIHRDIKPANVLRGEGGRIMLSDLGLALAFEEGQKPGRLVGTPRYIAPEVMAGEPATKLSDVWSLGVTLHELFFGSRPPDEVLATSRKSGSGPRGGLELALERLCQDCLNREPSLRPADGTAILKRLQDIGQRKGAKRRTAQLVVGGLGLATATVVAVSLSLPRKIVPLYDLVPKIYVESPKNHAGASVTYLDAIARGGDSLRETLSRSPNVKFVSAPPRRPTNVDWTLELSAGKTPEEVTCEATVIDGDGKRHMLAHSKRNLHGLNFHKQTPCGLDSELAVALESLAIETIRRAWVEQGTQNKAARTALLSLTSTAGPQQRTTQAIRRVVEFALEQDSSYLAAYVERAKLAVRRAGDLSESKRVEAHELRKYDAELLRRAPADARALSARCLLRETAFRLTPEPSDADLEEALALCRNADLAIAAGSEPQVSLARLSETACDPARAYEAIQRAILRSSLQQPEAVLEWATLALREHWHHANAIESNSLAMVAMRTAPQLPRLPYLLGALRLREGVRSRSRRWLEEAWRGPTEGAERAALAEALALTHGERLHLDLHPTALHILSQSNQQRVVARFEAFPRDGVSVAETISWLSPLTARRLLESLPPASSCMDSLERTKLSRSLKIPTREDAELPLCRSNAGWIRRCRQYLARPLGSEDPLRR